MGVRETRRAAALDQVADYMLENGLALSSVRALAQAAGISDRMLFYYFADKDDIMVSALQKVSARMSVILAGIVAPGKRGSVEGLLGELAAAARGPALRPFMRLWVEVVLHASRGEEPYLTVAGRIGDAFLAWIAGMIDLPEAAARREAARLIAIIDGVVLMDMFGRGEIADMAIGERF